MESLENYGRCMKLSLITLNVCTFIGGMLMLALGIWVSASQIFPTHLLKPTDLNQTCACTLIVTGFAIIFVSVLGCHAAVMEMKTMLLTYFILVFIIFVTMLASGICLIVIRQRTEGSMKREVPKLKDSMSLYGKREDITEGWDLVQSFLKCCGIDNYKDWKEAKIPQSCCKKFRSGKRQDCQQYPSPTTLYTDGCFRSSVDYLKTAVAISAGVAFLVAFLAMLGMVFSFGLLKTRE